uniref:Beta-defensin n=1 Tax=Jaculus jaculus TaxID=51337 RepID=A0A8C5KT47_JACJA|nr:beta-defensin 128 [Jaculus jaculus]
MKLFLGVIVLLSVVLTDGAKPPKCFNNIEGYCRKKCNLGEISEVSCLHDKLCCVNYERNKMKIQQLQKPVQIEKSEEVQDYIVLPTIPYETESM